MVDIQALEIALQDKEIRKFLIKIKQMMTAPREDSVLSSLHQLKP